MDFYLSKPWSDCTWVAIDLETTGAFPLKSDICEIGAVKWKNGKVIDRFQTLIKPTHQMSDFIIAIHNITNQMVENAPLISEKLHDFYKFIQGSVIAAHHAPFDIGFLAYEFEKNNIYVDSQPIVCTSLISRALIQGSKNHKLQTLIEHLGLPKRNAHRALDDAESCLDLLLKCFEVKKDLTIEDILKIQKKPLNWDDFSIFDLRRNEHLSRLIDAIGKKQKIDLNYLGGSRPGESRIVRPLGIVRNPDGDYFAAIEDGDDDDKRKRYQLDRVASIDFLDT